MCVTLPYKDGLRKYSLIFQCRPNSTHKIYIKSMLTVIGERREFFSISKTKSISYHPTQSYYEIDFHICLYSVATQKKQIQNEYLLWIYIISVYEMFFIIFIYIYIFLWEHLICIMSTAVFVFGVAYAVMQLF